MTSSILYLVAIALVGGLLPLVARWTHRQLHAVLALSTGIFLGAVFLHLLPSIAATPAGLPELGGLLAGSHASAEAGALDDHAGHDHGEDDHGDHEGHDHGEDDHGHGEADHDHDHGHSATADSHAEEAGSGGGHGHGHDHQPRTLWFFVLVGVIGVYLIEALLLRTHDHGDAHRHRSVGYATLLGVTVHALTAGFGLGAVVGDGTRFDVFLLAMLGHKGFEAFSLTTVFQLADFPRRRIIALMIAFSLVTPIGMLAAAEITGSLGESGIAIATAIAAGTFLYVCLSELLPEVFHHREDALAKILLLTTGVVLMVFFEGAHA